MKRVIYLLVLALVLSGAAWSQANAAAGTVEQVVPQVAAQFAGTYWTAERIRNAKPYPLPALKGPALPGALESGPTGPPGVEKAGLPGQTSALLSDDEFAALTYTGAFREAASVQPLSNGYDYPPPQNTFRIPDYLYGGTAKYFPYCTNGKVYFSQGAYNYQCSGSSIGGRAVLTAGHCVSDGNRHWNTNEVFIPSYRNNLRPFGTWTADWKTTSSDWFVNGHLGHFGRDVGFFTVANQSGVKLSAKVGSLGFAWNYSRVQMWNDFGYPAASPYNGAYLYCTQASYARTDGNMTPNTTAIGTVMTGGCSGGPWVLKFMNGNYANGLNSYVYTTPAQPKQIYSPYFDTWVHDNLYKVAIAR